MVPDERRRVPIFHSERKPDVRKLCHVNWYILSFVYGNADVTISELERSNGNSSPHHEINPRQLEDVTGPGVLMQ